MTSQHGVNSNPQSKDTLNISTLRETIDDVLHDFGVAESLGETQLSDKLKRKVITANEYDERLVENYRNHKKQALDQILKAVADTIEEAMPKKKVTYADYPEIVSEKNIGYNQALADIRNNINKELQ